MSQEGDFAAIAEQLWCGSDEERYRLLEHAARDPEAFVLLREAHLALAAEAVASSEGHRPFSDESSLELSRGRIAREAIVDWDEVEWLVASLTPGVDPAAERTSLSRSTRRSLRRLTATSPSAGIWRLSSWALPVAAAIVALLMWMPASEPWNDSLGLSRWRAMRLSDAMTADLRAALEGEFAPPLYESKGGEANRERSARYLDPATPALQSPLWEAVADEGLRFEWEGDAQAEYELLLVDDRRQLLWSAHVSAVTALEYPADRTALEPGRSYYWKVNRLGGDRLRASPFAAFRLLDASQTAALRDELSRAGRHPLLCALVYDRHGLYGAAAAQYREATDDPRFGAVAIQALEALRIKQRRVE